MNDLSSLLIKVTQSWKEGVTHLIEPHGISFTSYRLLNAICELQFGKGRSPSQKEAGELAALDLNVVSQTVKHLTQHHLINRELSESDGRAYRLSLTLAGQQLVLKVSEAVNDYNKEFFSAVHTDNFKEALQALLKH